MKIATIILAAGAASRFGSPKQLLEIDEENLTQRVAQLALEVGFLPIVVVSGAYHEQLEACDFKSEVTLIHHEEWSKGMGSSIAKGMEYVVQTDVDAVLILLADQPAITRDTIKRMLDRSLAPETTIVICDHGEEKGPPSLFKAKHFQSLLSLSGDIGGKEIVKRHELYTATIVAPEAQWDVDSYEEWMKFLNFRDLDAVRKS